MDEMHCDYRKIGGYTLEGETMSSCGYCDDTAILAGDVKTLKLMDDCTRKFFKKHKLTINATKSIITGTNGDGTQANIHIQWPGQKDPFPVAGHNDHIKYLGLQMNLSLDWSKQISKCNAPVMNIVARLRNKQITLLQGALLIKHYLTPKMDISFRHAEIPLDQIAEWDDKIARAIAQRAELTQMKLHKDSIFTILRCTKLESTYVNTQATGVFTTLVSGRMDQDRSMRHEVQRFEAECKHEEEGAHTPESLRRLHRHSNTDSHLRMILKRLYRDGITIAHNPERRQEEKVIDSYGPRRDLDYQHFEGHRIPIRNTYDLWGAKFPKADDTYATACTDGSTHTGKPSGAGIAFMCDGAEKAELWQIPGQYWTIENSNNHEAEMAAINKAISKIALTNCRILL